jgi:hypothetical protein
MSRLLPFEDIANDICLTCNGVLRLQARWTQFQGTGASRREDVERMAQEARWFAMALKKIRPCPSHGGVRRLASDLADELEAIDRFRGLRVE